MQFAMKTIKNKKKGYFSMFSIMELRLIRHSVKKIMENLQKRLKIIDPEGDDSVEISNDLMLYKIIIEKINDNPKV